VKRGRVEPSQKKRLNTQLQKLPKSHTVKITQPKHIETLAEKDEIVKRVYETIKANENLINKNPPALNGDPDRTPLNGDVGIEF